MANAPVTNPRGLPIREVKCFGIIPVRFINGFCELFIVQQKAGHWGFPKGHPEAGDKSEFDSACRELKEESNLEVKRLLFEDTFTDKYQYGKREFWKDKTVVFWVAETVDGGVIKLQETEVTDGKWVRAEEAHLSLASEHRRELLKAVLDKIKSL